MRFAGKTRSPQANFQKVVHKNAIKPNKGIPQIIIYNVVGNVFKNGTRALTFISCTLERVD